ncbi:DUF559 domain-containing protein [Mycolicibacterium sp. P9-64]|uniref:DUF559 domain-containing protein n=1 Tax=Mycolicibacterium sp. P9-64 TaxID=2024612 RepID=UPI0011EE3D6D|nr:DUF559 domain-containing protein [Mycolicibacterium sp. P9-64]KAA0080605.1 DUF559 domain-containing protein [Mycolicibacterium sp. P9-64]
MERIFVGSEALASGALTRYDLRRYHRRVLPDVYGPRRDPLSLSERTTAAWLWSRREGVVSGLAASAALGAKWVDASTAIELNWANNRSPLGVITRRDSLFDDEIALLEGMAATTADRTAFDLARRGPLGQAVARLDALARATHFKVEDVQALALRHPHVKGLRRVDRVLDLVDAGAESPKETWLRLLLMDAGFPRPQTQIPVLGPDGYPLYYLDMGWEDKMIAVEYDGVQHADQIGYDIVRSEYIASVGWTTIRVAAGHRRARIVHRVSRAWALSER